jgi:OmpA-OmpF porin, OOP family
MKKTNIIVVSAALAAAAISLPAAAQSKAFEPGFYLGFGAGQSRVNNGNQSGTFNGVAYTTTGFGDNKTTLQVSGGYQFTEMWGIELQYTDLGSRSGTITALGTTVGTPSVRAYQVGISGTGTYMFTPEWFARGKLGVSSNHLADLNVQVAGTPVNIGGSNHTDVLAGIGVGYKWNENFSSRLEYEYFGKFETSGGQTSNGTGSNIGLRMQYKF